MNLLIKKPSAWLPIAMSFIALAVLLVHFAKYGIIHETDEGTAAHLFQLFMAGQVPVIIFFLIRWLPKSPKKVLKILILQIVAVIVALIPVYYFKM